jgi:hypothetical protein
VSPSAGAQALMAARQSRIRDGINKDRPQVSEKKAALSL